MQGEVELGTWLACWATFFSQVADFPPGEAARFSDLGVGVGPTMLDAPCGAKAETAGVRLYITCNLRGAYPPFAFIVLSRRCCLVYALCEYNYLTQNIYHRTQEQAGLRAQRPRRIEHIVRLAPASGTRALAIAARQPPRAGRPSRGHAR